jgi:quinoprotein glucose dehydrogenase
MVAAIDPGSGKQRWVYDPHSYEAPTPHSVGWTVRGIAYWTDGRRERILHCTTDAYLISIDARTGRPDPAFGVDGRIDLIEGVPHNPIRSVNFAGRRALVAGNVIVVGSHIRIATAGKEEETPPGDIRGYDVHTGKLLWTFHIIPHKGEFGYETWLDGSAERVGNGNVWGGMAYDPQLDYVYAPTSAPGNDTYGASRPGDSLFTTALVCLEAKTGKRVWHFQTSHHDLWDYDLVTHPALVDITVNRRTIHAVVAISKNSFVYVLDRKTGKPMWPIEERPVPQATTANGERTSPTQPIPSKPAAPETQGSTPENIIDFTPDLKRRALEYLKNFDTGPIYTPPSDRGTLVVPGTIGGANWGGAAVDPVAGVLYIPTRLSMNILKANYPGRREAPAPEQQNPEAPTGPALRDATYVDDLPLIKPPYARMTAIDLNTGERRWMTPIGNGPRKHPQLKDLNLPPLGDSINGAAPLVTKSLLFVGVTYTGLTGRRQQPPWYKWNDLNFERKLLYILQKETGAILRVIETEHRSMAAPMTYMYGGKQYVVVAAGNAEECELLAFALPQVSSKVN